MKPVSPSVRRATLPLGRITKWVMLPLLRDRRSQPSGGNCSALVTKTHDQLDYQTLTAPPSVPDKGEEGENQNWWALCGLHSTGRSQPWKKAFSCGSAIKPQHWQLDRGQECTWLSRAQQMGVITADRISARGQKAAAGMQWGCQECSEQPRHRQDRGWPRLQLSLWGCSTTTPVQVGQGRAGSAPKGCLSRGEVDVANRDCHTPFQPCPHSRGNNTGFPPVACRHLGKKFTRTAFHQLHHSPGRTTKSTLSLPQKQHHSWSAAILNFLTQQPQVLHQLH